MKIEKADIRLPRQYQVSVHEHEVLVSFKDDDTAVLFDRWLYCGPGLDLFIEWAKTQPEDY